MSNKLVNNDNIKENGNEIPANQGDPAPETGNKDNGNDAGNTPESTPVEKKDGLFTWIGKKADSAIGAVVDTGKKALDFAKKHPKTTAVGAAAALYGGYRLVKSVKGNSDPVDDNIVDAEWHELPAVPEVPKIEQIEQVETVIPQVEIPDVPEVETVQEVLEGPTEGIFDE